MNVRKRLYEKANRRNLTDSYIKKLLGPGFNGYFTEDLIEVKRGLLKLRRMLLDTKE